ncbi:MAG: hypothetical protein ACRD3T_19725 [Terriglobia bacterium]
MLTFHKIIEECREGNAEAWRALATQYTPVLTGVARAYSSDPERVKNAWREVLGGLADHEFAALKAVDAHSDREFFAVLRSSLLDQMARGPEAVSYPGRLDATAALEVLSRLMKQFPLVHQNVAFLNLTGYSEPAIEQILRISPALAKNSVDRLNAEFDVEFRRRGEAVEGQAVWLRMINRMRANPTADCIPIRRLIRILDGQFGWYEKDPIEKHLAICLHCLEAWVGLQEITHWMRQGTPVTPEQVDELISALPLKAKSKDRLSLFKRAIH